MVYLSGLSLMVSMIGLFILLFASFASKEDQQLKNGFINKESRKIRFRKENGKVEKSNPKKPGPQFILTLQTIIIGQLVALFFLIFTKDQLKFTILTCNAIILISASFLCSILTLVNVWLKQKTNIFFRIILQIITLILGIALMQLSGKGEAVILGGYMVIGIYGYYITVVIALGTMLYNVVFGNKVNKLEFNFSNYLLIVIASGLIIGTGLLLTSSLKF